MIINNFCRESSFNLPMVIYRLAAKTLFILFFLTTNNHAQYWGNHMMQTYSETLRNGKVGTLTTSKTLDVVDNYIYLADQYGLTIIDASDPSNPSQVSNLGLPGSTSDILVSNNYAYMTTIDGFTIIDVHNPSYPQQVSYVKLQNNAFDIEIRDSLLLIATAVGIEVYDISNPNEPQFRSSVQIDNSGSHNLVLNPRAEIVYFTSNRNLFVVDISNLSSMQVLSSQEFNPTSINGTCWDGGKISGNYLYVTVTTAQHIYDISNPEQPILIYEYIPVMHSVYSSVVEGELFISGHWASAGWFTMDVSQPDSPKVIKQYDYPLNGYGYGMSKLKNDILYLLNYQQGTKPEAGWRLRIIDVSNPGSAVELGSIDSETSGYTVAHTIIELEEQIIALTIQNNRVYNGGLETFGGKLTILDVTDEENPILLSTLEIPRTCIAITANRKVAIIRGFQIGNGSYEHAIFAVSLNDLTNPIIIDQKPLPQSLINDIPQSLDIFENKLYVACDPFLRVYEITEQNQLELLISQAVSKPRGVVVRKKEDKTIGYLACGPSGFQIYDLTELTNISLLGFNQTQGTADGLHVDDKYAYLVLGDAGLHIFDIQNNSAVSIKRVSTIGRAKNITVENNLAFIQIFFNDNDQKLQVFDIENKISPRSLGTYQANGIVKYLSLIDRGKKLFASNYYSFSIYRPLFNFRPLPFALSSPDNGASVSGDINFEWYHSFDANDDTLQYELKIWNENWDTTFSVSADTHITVQSTLLPGDGNYSWTVRGYDGEYYVNSIDTFSVNITVVSVENPNLHTPTTYQLHSNYPNPFNPSTNIKFDLPVDSDVTITVFNSLGQEVTQIMNKTMKAGQHNIVWSGNYSSGVYYIRMQAMADDYAAAYVKTIKAIFIK